MDILVLSQMNIVVLPQKIIVSSVDKYEIQVLIWQTSTGEMWVGGRQIKKCVTKYLPQRKDDAQNDDGILDFFKQIAFSGCMRYTINVSVKDNI